MGFGMRARSPARRWALTPPFHPYPFGRSVFCATFRGSLRAVVNGHPALWSPDFPLRQAKRSSGALSAIQTVAWCQCANGVFMPPALMDYAELDYHPGFKL